MAPSPLSPRGERACEDALRGGAVRVILAESAKIVPGWRNLQAAMLARRTHSASWRCRAATGPAPLCSGGSIYPHTRSRARCACEGEEDGAGGERCGSGSRSPLDPPAAAAATPCANASAGLLECPCTRLQSRSTAARRPLVNSGPSPSPAAAATARPLARACCSTAAPNGRPPSPRMPAPKPAVAAPSVVAD